MTLFETSPQFTMFVLFFMVGFVTRFFAQIAFFAGGIACKAVKTQVVLAFKKIGGKFKKAFQKWVESGAKAKKGQEVKKKELGKMAKQKQGEAVKSRLSFWELIYFAVLGILTIEVFSKFDFVDFFWFIPLAVILGVVCHDYLTKEVFAKRKKV